MALHDCGKPPQIRLNTPKSYNSDTVAAVVGVGGPLLNASLASALICRNPKGSPNSRPPTCGRSELVARGFGPALLGSRYGDQRKANGCLVASA